MADPGDGILSGPLDVDGSRRRRGPEAIPVDVSIGMELTHRSTSTSGVVVRYVEGRQVVLRDSSGREHAFRPTAAELSHAGRPVALRRLLPRTDPAVDFTPSGSLDAGPVRARVARASRIYVEGIHDAELVERVWGDDLRVEGIVVEIMDGADDLVVLVDSFEPTPTRRLGVLVDHLIPGTKEHRLASAISHPDVLVCGHPFVDVWEAVRPAVLGLEAWPKVPLGQPWKEGVLEALGVDAEPRVFWRRLLARVSDYRDLETPLINAVERLIDFVTDTQGGGKQTSAPAN